MASLTLDGKTYTVTPLATKIGLRTFVRLGKMMGPGFAKLIANPELLRKDIASAEFGALVGDLFDRLDNPELESTVEVIMDSVEQDGATLRQRWMGEFSGRLATLCRILLFAIGEHFGDFTRALTQPVNSASAAAAVKASGTPS